MGGQSKSAELHELQGTSPHRSSVPAESDVAAALPRPPKFLSKEARKKFKQLVKQLAARRAVTAGGEAPTLSQFTYRLGRDGRRL